jgi:3-oxoacyl-[acyl-carrier-protein] synthase-3
MTINKLGNSSVATVPTLYDMILKVELEDHKEYY